MDKIISILNEANNKIYGLLQESYISQGAVRAICEIIDTAEKHVRGILENEQKGYENNTVGANKRIKKRTTTTNQDNKK